MASKVKCPVCNSMIEKEGSVAYNKRYYCIECFESKFSEEEVAKHYFYQTFQEIFNRKPIQLEWIQCDRLISDGWTWQMIEDILKYVYTVECLPEREEGVIGILPYYEVKARKFVNRIYDAYDSPVYNIEGTDEVVYAKQVDLTHLGENKEIVKDVDAIWEDDDTWQ